jgi:uncharacterized phage protein gp47/JayE
MGTLGAQITATGIQAPSYPDVLQQLKIAYWSIYGADADLDDDTQDGQLLAVFAQAIDDCNQAAIATYNSFSPATAVGAGLASVVKINGLEKAVATNSQCIVTIVGQAFSVITNGLVGDDQNLSTQWALPDVVNIPGSGTVDVTATCLTAGAVQAAANTLTVILTPTAGWQSVINAAPATPGNPVELDPALRQRQSNSTARPALTILESIYGAIAELGGVIRLQVYENDTDVMDGNTLPPHSISAVVQGGDIEEIAAAIALTKSPGTSTYGSEAVVITDTHGIPSTIRFYPLTLVVLDVTVNIHALTGFVSTTASVIKQAVADFINALDIGEKSYTARLYSPANLGGVGLGATFVVTSITQGLHGGGQSGADVAIAFNQGASTVLANITVVVT